MADINKIVNVTYNNFKNLDVIDPDQFDKNNDDLCDKIDEVVELVNKYNKTTDNNSGADNIAITTIQTYSATSVQEFLEELLNSLQAIADGVSGADLVGATAIDGINGVTIQSILESLKSYIDTYNSTQDSNLNTHKSSGDHDDRYYTQLEIDTDFATKDELFDVTLGLIPDNSLTTAKMATEQKRGSANGVASLNSNQKVIEDPASKGQANGLATLDENGQVPTNQLTNVNDILDEFKLTIANGGLI